MKLRLKKNAVIRVEIIGTGKPFYKVGKVANVFEDEVVLVEQIGIKVKEKYDDWLPGVQEYEYDQKRTIDGKEIHVNRALIASWEYVTKDVAMILPHSLEKQDLEKATITYYDENGYCHGEETDFGDIPDSSSSYIAVGLPEDDEDNSDGLELSL